MQILFIEDSEDKAKAVTTLMLEVCGRKTVEIRQARSVAAGRRALSEQHFDLLVLDLMLPLRDGGVPEGRGGADLLDEIVAMDTLLKPTHIVCLTEYPDLAKVIDSDVQRSLVHVVQFDDRNAKWQSSMRKKLVYISRRIKTIADSPKPFDVDLAIITSAPAVEITEVLRTDGRFKGEFHRDDALHYYLTEWTRLDGKILKVVACAAPQMGMTAACITTHKLIDRWRPRFVAMTGIAASTKREQKVGDILLGEIVFDYGSGKIIESRDGSRAFAPDPRPLTIDVQLKALLQVCERDQPYVSEFMRQWRGAKIKNTPTIRLGVLASGAAVIQNRELVSEILKTSRKVVGLEMEAYGVFHAAELCKEPRPRVLIAKSVSDYADSRKADQWQQLAAFTSAQFVRAFFTECQELL